MFFFQLDTFLKFGLGALFVLLGILAFRAVRSQDLLVRLPVWFVSAVLVIIGLVGGLFFGLGSLSGSNSASIDSPDRKHAIRIENSDEGALGGDTFVILYSAHGLVSDAIFSGEWKVVEAKDVRWFGNTTVRITYRANPYRMTCQSAREIEVKCEQALDPVH
jgi:hypothetical protein